MAQITGVVREYNIEGGWGLLDATTRPKTMSDKECEQGIYCTKESINSIEKNMTFLPKYKLEVGEKVSFTAKKGPDGWWIADNVSNEKGEPLSNDMQKKVLQYYYTGSVPKEQGGKGKGKGKNKGDDNAEEQVSQQASTANNAQSMWGGNQSVAQQYDQYGQYAQYGQYGQLAAEQVAQQMVQIATGWPSSMWNPMMLWGQDTQVAQQQEQEQQQEWQKPVADKPTDVELLPNFAELETKRAEIEAERSAKRKAAQKEQQQAQYKIPAWEQPGRRVRKILPLPGESPDEYELKRQVRLSEARELAENEEAWVQVAAKYPELLDEDGNIEKPMTGKRSIESIYEQIYEPGDMSQNYQNRDGKRVPIEEFIRAEALNADAQKTLLSLDDGIRRAVIRKWTSCDNSKDQSGRFIAFCKSFHREGAAPPGQGKWHGLRGKQWRKENKAKKKAEMSGRLM
eukprot:gnl/MRDRNA2_/MRDRNA2_94795_c0_seq1.p1 gnl/MRDRNA2_/MRDRNA2_94795_c0~~gnl/MRDRNA2_/MRDRNA2_94795_c0_seq1.p1  ORF type:complete len:455 (+),score=128.35 gnl/MRDRNA2_/MRDRNA2_94795_c0_seq1:72-1436(+)